MAVPSRPPVQVRDDVQLNETEQKIFDWLLGTLRCFGLQNQLRVAGGWVRDKLLGKECYDIDISLDNMLGSEFVDKVQDYFARRGRGPGNRCNSMQKYGTPKEDAYRRDLTINSLFYNNLNTSLIEDYTTRGLFSAYGIEDLKSGVIVTPLPPKATFMHDPLRVLRAIRFGARFGFIFR